MPITLDGQTVPLPKNYAATLMKQAFQQSVIAPLTSSEPFPMGVDTVIPQYDGGIEAGFVGEAEAKPVADAAYTFKTLKPRKLATIVVVSKEAAKVNPLQMMQMVETDMKNAITRAVDFAILYGKNAKDGADLANAEFVNKTTNRVEVSANDLVPQILAGYDLAADKENSDPTGFAFDSRWRSKVALATQQQVTLPGAPTPMPNLGQAADSVAGLKAVYGRVVAGKVGTNQDTKVRGFVGDWNKVRWGYVEQITMQRSTEATIVDGDKTYHLFQQNLMALLVEAHVAWTVLDTEAFAAYEDKVA